MSKGELERFLTKPLIARLATLGQDGYPNIHPLWFIYGKGEFLFTTIKGSVKTRNIRQNSRVAVAIDESGEKTRGVVVKGRAEIMEEISISISKRILLKYLGSTDNPRY